MNQAFKNLTSRLVPTLGSASAKALSQQATASFKPCGATAFSAGRYNIRYYTKKKKQSSKQGSKDSLLPFLKGNIVKKNEPPPNQFTCNFTTKSKLCLKNSLPICGKDKKKEDECPGIKRSKIGNFRVVKIDTKICKKMPFHCPTGCKRKSEQLREKVCGSKEQLGPKSKPAVSEKTETKENKFKELEKKTAELRSSVCIPCRYEKIQPAIREMKADQGSKEEPKEDSCKEFGKKTTELRSSVCIPCKYEKIQPAIRGTKADHESACKFPTSKAKVKPPPQKSNLASDKRSLINSICSIFMAKKSSKPSVTTKSSHAPQHQTKKLETKTPEDLFNAIKEGYPKGREKQTLKKDKCGEIDEGQIPMKACMSEAKVCAMKRVASRKQEEEKEEDVEAKMEALIPMKACTGKAKVCAMKRVALRKQEAEKAAKMEDDGKPKTLMQQCEAACKSGKKLGDDGDKPVIKMCEKPEITMCEKPHETTSKCNPTPPEKSPKACANKEETKPKSLGCDRVEVKDGGKPFTIKMCPPIENKCDKTKDLDCKNFPPSLESLKDKVKVKDDCKSVTIKKCPPIENKCDKTKDLECKNFPPSLESLKIKDQNKCNKTTDLDCKNFPPSLESLKIKDQDCEDKPCERRSEIRRKRCSEESVCERKSNVKRKLCEEAKGQKKTKCLDCQDFPPSLDSLKIKVSDDCNTVEIKMCPPIENIRDKSENVVCERKSTRKKDLCGGDSKKSLDCKNFPPPLESLEIKVKDDCSQPYTIKQCPQIQECSESYTVKQCPPIQECSESYMVKQCPPIKDDCGTTSKDLDCKNFPPKLESLKVKAELTEQPLECERISKNKSKLCEEESEEVCLRRFELRRKRLCEESAPKNLCGVDGKLPICGKAKLQPNVCPEKPKKLKICGQKSELKDCEEKPIKRKICGKGKKKSKTDCNNVDPPHNDGSAKFTARSTKSCDNVLQKVDMQETRETQSMPNLLEAKSLRDFIGSGKPQDHCKNFRRGDSSKKLDKCKKEPPCPKPDPCKKPPPCPKPDPCKKPPPCPKPDPCKKPSPCSKPDPCKKEPPCPKPDPCKKPPPCPKPDPCKKPPPCPKPDPCKKEPPCPKPDPCKKPPPCPKPDPCKKPPPCPKPDPCKKPPPCPKPDPCKKPPPCPKPDPCKKPPPCPKPDPCKKPPPCPKPDPCKKPPPCPKPDPCKKPPPCPKPDPCKKPPPCPKPDPCKKEPPCPKPNPCKKPPSCPKPDPCKKAEPCAKSDPCKKAPASCQKDDPCKKKQDPPKKEEPPKKVPKRDMPCEKPSFCKQKAKEPCKEKSSGKEEKDPCKKEPPKQCSSLENLSEKESITIIHNIEVIEDNEVQPSVILIPVSLEHQPTESNTSVNALVEIDVPQQTTYAVPNITTAHLIDNVMLFSKRKQDPCKEGSCPSEIDLTKQYTSKRKNKKKNKRKKSTYRKMEFPKGYYHTKSATRIYLDYLLGLPNKREEAVNGGTFAQNQKNSNDILDDPSEQGSIAALFERNTATQSLGKFSTGGRSLNNICRLLQMKQFDDQTFQKFQKLYTNAQEAEVICAPKVQEKKNEKNNHRLNLTELVKKFCSRSSDSVGAIKVSDIMNKVKMRRNEENFLGGLSENNLIPKNLKDFLSKQTDIRVEKNRTEVSQTANEQTLFCVEHKGPQNGQLQASGVSEQVSVKKKTGHEDFLSALHEEQEDLRNIFSVKDKDEEPDNVMYKVKLFRNEDSSFASINDEILKTTTIIRKVDSAENIEDLNNDLSKGAVGERFFKKLRYDKEAGNEDSLCNLWCAEHLDAEEQFLRDKSQDGKPQI